MVEFFGRPSEQLLNVLVYFMPVNKDANGVSGTHPQHFFVVSDLLSLHRTMLLRRPEAAPVATDQKAADLVAKRATYFVSAFTLRALRALQVWLEMHVHRALGGDQALRFCFVLEVIKLVLKMVSQSATPFAIHVDEEAVDVVEDSESVVAKQGGSGVYIAAKPLHSKDCSETSLGVVVGETLYHARPLVHLFLLMQLGRKSWKAWCTAVGLDYLSMVFLAAALRPRNHTRGFDFEAAEMQRRRNRLWWAAARSPLFDEIFQKPIEDLDAFIKNVPVLSLFRFPELFLALQPFWFSTSAS